MQTFLPFFDFEMSARCLDRQRLGKQRLEAKHILEILLGYRPNDSYKNHPAVQMWKGYEYHLANYGCAVCVEWRQRKYKDQQLPWFEKQLYNKLSYNNEAPWWLGKTEFHISHQSNLLRKDFEYYSQYFYCVPRNIDYWWPTKNVEAVMGGTSGL
jgi:hypothetical protein